MSLHHYLRQSSDPALRAVVVDDAAAFVGVGWPSAFGLALPIADYLIGRSLPAERFPQVSTNPSNDPAVREALALQAEHIGRLEVVDRGGQRAH